MNTEAYLDFEEMYEDLAFDILVEEGHCPDEARRMVSERLFQMWQSERCNTGRRNCGTLHRYY